MAPKDDLRVNLSTDRSSRIKCLECGHKNPGDVAFCTKCRAKMVLECANCGFKSPQRSEFCGSCGQETEFGSEERWHREHREREKARVKKARIADKNRRKSREFHIPTDIVICLLIGATLLGLFLVIYGLNTL